MKEFMRAMRTITFSVLFTGAFTLLFAHGAFAGPTDEVVIEVPPDDQGAAFVPVGRQVVDLPGDFVEEEYFVSGAATLFNYAHNPPLGPTDIVPIQEDVPYKTRVLIRRPAKAGKFNGTVVIEWWNSTAGFDSAPVWNASAEYFARNGIVYVGVTNSTTSLGFLTGGCRLFGVLPPTCGTRYGTLSLPENGLAYEMVSQIANLLKSDWAPNLLPTDFEVERILHAGEQQQGSSIITYANAFHLPGVNDGYFIQKAATARSINFGPACDAAGSPPFPLCTPRLEDADRLVRSDLPVPVYQALTETDVAVLFGTIGRQPDTPTYRYYELAGTGHLTLHVGVEILPAGVIGPDPLFLEDLCQFPINSMADGPVFGSYAVNALWEQIQDQITDGTTPPAGVVMEMVGPDIQRDGFGNALGGVRLPSMEVPTATYGPTNQADPTLPPFLQAIGNLVCFLAGTVQPFDDATLDTFYPNHGSYVSQVVRAANALKAQGFLLQSDARTIRNEAVGSGIGR